jgi:hypothetical protein
MRLVPVVESGMLYEEAAFDGATLYHLSRLDLRNVKRLTDKPMSSFNVATAGIYNRQRVVNGMFGHPFAPLWLVFASGEYLKTCSNNLVEPVIMLGLFELDHYYERPFKVAARWSLQTSPPFLPVEALYLDDGEVKTDPQFPPYKRKPPFDTGFTNVTYKVLEFTNCAGVEVPRVAEVDTYRPDWGGKPELLHFMRYRISVERWTNGTRPTLFRPKLPGKTSISDTRALETFGTFSYHATNDWPSVEEAVAGEALRRLNRR